jgi:hypothetical protein
VNGPAGCIGSAGVRQVAPRGAPKERVLQARGEALRAREKLQWK